MKRHLTVEYMDARVKALGLANKPDQDPDLDLKKNNLDLDRSRSTQPVKTTNPSNPDGLNHLIKGQYADLLKKDSAYLQARAWGVHPATLTNATKRMGADWVRQQVAFVAGQDKVRFKGGYLSKILARNPH